MKRYFSHLFKEGEDPDQFALWAFGSQFEKLEKGMEFLYAWNVLHENEYHLKADGYPVNDAIKMVALWRESDSAKNQTKRGG